MKKNYKAGTALVLLMLLTACATVETPTSWLNNAQKIDEENGHK